MLRVLITGYLSKIYKPDASATVTIILSIRSSKIGIMSKKCVFCLQRKAARRPSGLVGKLHIC